MSSDKEDSCSPAAAGAVSTTPGATDHEPSVIPNANAALFGTEMGSRHPSSHVKIPLQLRARNFARNDHIT